VTTAIASPADFFPNGREPAGLSELQDWVHEEIAVGMRAALRIALLLAHARDAYFADAPAEWLTWAREQFGYERRHCFRCLKAGRLLLLDGVPHEALARCDLEKLEMLARIPGHQLPALLERWDPSTATRAEVRAKVKMWEDPEEPGGEDEEDARAKRTPPRTKTPAEILEDEIVKVRMLLDDENGPDLVAAVVDEPMVVRTAGQLLALGVRKQLTHTTWTDTTVEAIASAIDDLQADLQTLKERLGMNG